jgi:hypothetical protein
MVVLEVMLSAQMENVTPPIALPSQVVEVVARPARSLPIHVLMVLATRRKATAVLTDVLRIRSSDVLSIAPVSQILPHVQVHPLVATPSSVLMVLGLLLQAVLAKA